MLCNNFRLFRGFPVVVYVILWMKSNICVQVYLKNVVRRTAQLSQKLKFRFVVLAQKATRFIGNRSDRDVSLAPISRNDDL
jgi:hypothetical protein